MIQWRPSPRPSTWHAAVLLHRCQYITTPSQVCGFFISWGMCPDHVLVKHCHWHCQFEFICTHQESLWVLDKSEFNLYTDFSWPVWRTARQSYFLIANGKLASSQLGLSNAISMPPCKDTFSTLSCKPQVCAFNLFITLHYRKCQEEADVAAWMDALPHP